MLDVALEIAVPLRSQRKANEGAPDHVPAPQVIRWPLRAVPARLGRALLTGTAASIPTGALDAAEAPAAFDPVTRHWIAWKASAAVTA